MFTFTLLKEFCGHFKEVLDMNLSVVLVQYCLRNECRNCLNVLCPSSGLCHVFDTLGM